MRLFIFICGVVWCGVCVCVCVCECVSVSVCVCVCDLGSEKSN